MAEQKIEWFHITKDFEDFKPLIKIQQDAKLALRKANRRIKTFQTKYNFLDEIIQIGSNDDLLAKGIKSLLKDAGFEKVVNFKDKKSKTKREDMQAWHGNDVFIIEVKGINSPNPKYTDLIQVLPYTNTHRKTLAPLNVHGLSIINQDNAKSLNKRSRCFYTTELNGDLKNCELTAISAIDLLELYKNLKSGKITFEVMKEKMKILGIPTYDSKGGKTLK